jgi:hypothetical protein
MTICYCLRFDCPQPGGPGHRVYIPQALGSLFVDCDELNVGWQNLEEQEHKEDYK